MRHDKPKLSAEGEKKKSLVLPKLCVFRLGTKKTVFENFARVSLLHNIFLLYWWPWQVDISGEPLGGKQPY
jgi:hypothetical protein